MSVFNHEFKITQQVEEKVSAYLLKAEKETGTRLSLDNDAKMWLYKRLNFAPAKAQMLTPTLSYIYPGEALPEIFGVDPIINPLAWQNFFTSKQGVKTGEFVHIATEIKNVMRKAGRCKEPFRLSNNVIYDRKFDPVRLDLRTEFCNADLEKTVFAKRFNSGNDWRNIDCTIFRALLDQLLLIAMEKDIFRYISFGVRDDAGVLGIHESYESFDGLITRVLSDENYGCIARDTITSLSLDSADNAITWLNYQISELAPDELYEIKERGVLMVTPNLYKNLRNLYRLTPANNGGFISNLEGFPNVITFDDIPVVPVTQWAQDLRDPNNPLFGQVNTISIFAIPENLVVAYDAPSDLSTIEGRFDWDEDVTKFKAASMLDFNFAYCPWFSVLTGNV